VREPACAAGVAGGMLVGGWGITPAENLRPMKPVALVESVEIL
jgi:hypothetical protein